MRACFAAVVLVASILLGGSAIGQVRRGDLQPLPEPPPLPQGATVEAEPQVTVRRSGGDSIEEYRVGGRIVMIRVTPAHGVPYVLTDPRGDGTLSNRRDTLEVPPSVPMWVLFTF